MIFKNLFVQHYLLIAILVYHQTHFCVANDHVLCELLYYLYVYIYCICGNICDVLVFIYFMGDG